MKKFITLVTVIIACLFAVQAATYTSYTLNLFKYYNSDEPIFKEKPDPKGHRTPARPIGCTINEIL